jgi:hypothetical protein
MLAPPSYSNAWRATPYTFHASVISDNTSASARWLPELYALICAAIAALILRGW